MVKGVFVVVITHNGEKDIDCFLDTYRAYTPGNVPLIVVDNASSDRTLDIVREQYSDAVIVQNTINRGYAGGAREGMDYALSHGAEYVAVVNQDVQFSERWLDELIEYLDTHPKCAAVQPRIMMYPETDIINSYGNAQHYLGFGYTLGYKNTLYSCENGKELATCSGAAVLFRSSSLRDVGHIDERYFMYYEDSDLSWRLRLRGYSLALCCGSTVFHRYEFSRSIQKFYFMERNRLILMMTNYSLKTLLLIAPMMIVMEAGMIAYSLLGTLLGKRDGLTLKEKARSYCYFFRPSTLRYLAQKRSTVQGSRRVSDKEIVRVFVDVVEFQDIDNVILRKIANPLTRWYWNVVHIFI